MAEKTLCISVPPLKFLCGALVQKCLHIGKTALVKKFVTKEVFELLEHLTVVEVEKSGPPRNSDWEDFSVRKHILIRIPKSIQVTYKEAKYRFLKESAYCYYFCVNNPTPFESKFLQKPWEVKSSFICFQCLGGTLTRRSMKRRKKGSILHFIPSEKDPDVCIYCYYMRQTLDKRKIWWSRAAAEEIARLQRDFLTVFRSQSETGPMNTGCFITMVKRNDDEDLPRQFLWKLHDRWMLYA